VSEILLDEAKMDTIFKEMSCLGMAQGVDRGALVHGAFSQGFPESILNVAFGHGFSGRSSVNPPTTGSREEPHAIAMGCLVLTKEKTNVRGGRGT
jgi:hypothetical protein